MYACSPNQSHLIKCTLQTRATLSNVTYLEEKNSTLVCKEHEHVLSKPEPPYETYSPNESLLTTYCSFHTCKEDTQTTMREDDERGRRRICACLAFRLAHRGGDRRTDCHHRTTSRIKVVCKKQQQQQQAANATSDDERPRFCRPLARARSLAACFLSATIPSSPPLSLPLRTTRIESIRLRVVQVRLDSTREVLILLSSCSRESPGRGLQHYFLRSVTASNSESRHSFCL